MKATHPPLSNSILVVSGQESYIESRRFFFDLSDSHLGTLGFGIGLVGRARVKGAWGIDGWGIEGALGGEGKWVGGWRGYRDGRDAGNLPGSGTRYIHSVLLAVSLFPTCSNKPNLLNCVMMRLMPFIKSVVWEWELKMKAPSWMYRISSRLKVVPLLSWDAG